MAEEVDIGPGHTKSSSFTFGIIKILLTNAGISKPAWIQQSLIVTVRKFKKLSIVDETYTRSKALNERFFN